MNQRISWIDNVKFFAIFCVIYGHCNGFIINPEGIKGWYFWNSLIVAFNMPLFMFISGYLSSGSFSKLNNKTDLGLFLCKNTERIGVPNLFFTFFAAGYKSLFENYKISLLLFGSLLIMAIFVFNKDRIKYGSVFYKIFIASIIVVNFFSRPAYFWFLTVLLSIVVTVGISVYCYKKKYYWGILGSLALFLFCSYKFPLYQPDMLIYYLIGLYVGYLVSSTRILHGYNSLKHKNAVGGGISLLLITISLVLFPNIQRYNFYLFSVFDLFSMDSVHILLIRLLCGLLISVGICILFSIICQKKTWLTYWGTRTLTLYLIHAFMLGRFRCHAFVIDSNSPYAWANASIFAIAILIASMIVDFIISKSSLFSYLLFGDLKRIKAKVI